MILGDHVLSKLTPGWYFVTDDAHDINGRLHREFCGDADPNRKPRLRAGTPGECRLVCNPSYWDGEQRLGVVEWFPISRMNRQDVEELEDVSRLPIHADGGLWILALTPKDQQTDDPLCGEPDERILTACRMFDRRRKSSTFNARRWHRFATAQAELAEQRERAELLERATEWAEQWHHQHIRSRGDRHPRIWVPDNAVLH